MTAVLGRGAVVVDGRRRGRDDHDPPLQRRPPESAQQALRRAVEEGLRRELDDRNARYKTFGDPATERTGSISAETRSFSRKEYYHLSPVNIVSGDKLIKKLIRKSGSLDDNYGT
jgi:hypothetical protein